MACDIEQFKALHSQILQNKSQYWKQATLNLTVLSKANIRCAL